MRPRENKGTGFSLIEVMAVIVIVSLMVASVSMACYGPIVNIREAEFKNKFIDFQQECRDLCRKFGKPGQLSINQNFLLWTFDETDRKVSRKMMLGSSCRIDATIVSKDEIQSNDDVVNDDVVKERFERGEVDGSSIALGATQTKHYSTTTIRIDFQGVSRDLAVHIVTRRGRSYWLFVIGGTGEVMECQSESAVRNLFHEIQTIKNT